MTLSAHTTPHLLIIGLRWPEPKSSAAGSRMMQLIQLFKREGWKLSFCCAAQPSEFSENLEALDVATFQIPLNDARAQQLIADCQPDAVLFDRFMTEEQFGWQVAEMCPQAIRILDTEDLHFLRKARQDTFKKTSSLQNVNLKTEVAKREIAAILRSDMSLLISETEYQLLVDEFKIDSELLCYLPFLIESITEKQKGELPNFEQRTDFMFIGNFLHQPNYDAILYLKTDIWPQIRRQLSQARLLIYGGYPVQKVTQLHNPKTGFIVKGRADTVGEVMQKARVLLAPLRYGAGLKGKFFDAMRYGLPAVTTAIGAEGIADNENFNGMVTEDAHSCIEAAVKLYTQQELWQQKRDKGYQLLNNKFAISNYSDSFIRKLSDYQTHLEAKRSANFIGQILQHHRQLSTRYLAKWIEAKHQNH